MTVSTQTSRADYTGNGVTTSFAVPFYFLDNSHLTVLRTQISTGVVTTLVLTTDYGVTGAGVGSGGAVICTTAPTADQKLSILRSVPLTQLVHYVPNDPFPAATHEQALDQLTMEVQQVNEIAGRALTLPANTTGVSTSLPAPAANNILGWNGNSTGLQNIPISTLATAVTYGTAASDVLSGNGAQTSFTLSGNPGALNNLDVSISGVTQRPGIDYTWASGTTITFTTAPVAGVGNILVRYMQALAQGASDAGSTIYSDAATYGTGTVGYRLKQLLSSVGASLVGFLQAGTGAVTTRTVQDKLRESVSVLDFGADKTGVADCTAAINAAMTALGANGGTVIFPAGTYKWSGNLAFPRMSVIWQGAGGIAAGSNDGTVMTFTGTNATVPITMDSSFGCGIRDIVFVNNNAAFTGYCLRITNTLTDPQMCFLERVGFYDPNLSWVPLFLNKCIEFSAHKCNFVGGSAAIQGRTGGGAGNYSNGIQISYCQFQGSTNAPIQEMGESWSLIGNTFENLASGAPGGILTTSTNAPIGAFIAGNWFGDATLAGTWLTLWGTGHTVVGNKFDGGGVSVTCIALNAVVGANITGNNFASANIAITCNTAGCDRLTIEPNNYTSITTRLANPSNLAGYVQAATGNNNATAWEWTQNGKVREWGNATVTTGTPLAITFPKAMAAAPESVNLSLNNPSGSGNTVYASSIGASGMTLNVAGTAGASTVYWEASGAT